MKNPEELIGKKVRGIKFKEFTHAGFTETMESFIGKDGIIESYNKNTNCFLIRFDIDNFRQWVYPADQIEAHLVEDEIPTLSDGVMMLVSLNKTTWNKHIVFGFKNGFHFAWYNESRTIASSFRYAKPIEPTNEQQLTVILGSSEKESEIMELFKN